ncbi:MAG TPA: hypothetical protein VMT70_21450 [Vicinamibacteria bacterium]|nr:hypothetical protein [Vicinamibacteria bacterium]
MDEPGADLHFEVSLSNSDLHGTPPGWTPLQGAPDEEAILLAVAHAVDNSVLEQRGEAKSTVRHSVKVDRREVYEAREMLTR